MGEVRRAVDLISPRGSVRAGELVIRDQSSDDSAQVELVLSLPDRQVGAVASDGFEALVAIRREVEPEGWRIFCWGACLHVYPSELSRSRGIGDSAYRLTLGRFARASDVVNIFESGPGLVVATVEEQEDYSRAWFDSLMDLPD